MDPIIRNTISGGARQPFLVKILSILFQFLFRDFLSVDPSTGVDPKRKRSRSMFIALIVIHQNWSTTRNFNIVVPRKKPRLVISHECRRQHITPPFAFHGASTLRYCKLQALAATAGKLARLLEASPRTPGSVLQCWRQMALEPESPVDPSSIKDCEFAINSVSMYFQQDASRPSDDK